MKILVIALSGIGDALMFTPALSELRRNYPDSKISALVMYGGVKDIYERLGFIDEVYHFNFLKEGMLSSLKFLFGLRKKFDVSFNVYPSNRKEYNVISFMIGADKRCAAKYLRKDFVNLGWLNNVRVYEDDKVHNVRTNLKLVETFTKQSSGEGADLIFNLTEKDVLYSKEFLDKNKLSNNDLIIGFHPGCATLKNHIKRRWEPHKFAELGKRLIDELNAKVLIFGGPEESELKKSVFSGIGSDRAVVVDSDNLAGTAAIMKHCQLFITNDSSLMHVASAMKLKVAAIIGPTNSNYIHPWNTEHSIISLNLDCSPCFIYSPRPLKCFRSDVKFKCIKELTVDMVYSSAISLLKS